MNSVKYYRKFKSSWSGRNYITESLQSAVWRDTKGANKQNNRKKKQKTEIHTKTPLSVRRFGLQKGYSTKMVWSIKTFNDIYEKSGR